MLSLLFEVPFPLKEQKHLRIGGFEKELFRETPGRCHVKLRGFHPSFNDGSQRGCFEDDILRYFKNPSLEMS